MPSIAARVKALRLGRQLSQAKLAQEIGIAQPSIANIERGRTNEIKGYVLARLAVALHTTPEYILNGGNRPEDIDGAADEAELLGAFRQMSSDDRSMLLRHVRGMLVTAAPSPINPFPGKTKAKERA